MTVWNLGSINIDNVYRLADLPRPGETLTAQDHAVGLGGKGANQSVAAAKAGSNVRHLGAIGTDDQWVIDRLAEDGVGTDRILRLSDHATGHAIILLDAGGENSIVVHPGANHQIRVDDNCLSAMRPDDILLIQNETNLQAEMAQKARSLGVKVIYSAAPFDIDALDAVLPHVSILAMNAGEADQMEAALGAAPAVEGLLITRGGDGAEYRDLITGETYHTAPFAVDVVDTTGAGDCFAGYFAASLDQGLDIRQALRRASAAAALAVSRPGASAGIPRAAEVEVFLAGRP